MAEAKEGIPANQLEENPDLDVEREVITFDDSSNKGYKHNSAPNFPKGKVFEFTDQTTPATPTTDQTKFYAKSDGMYYLKDDGNETKLLDFAGTTLSKLHTNFSPTHIKEDTEDSEFLNQYGVVDRIGYGYQTGFESIDPDTIKLDNVQQAVVPAKSHEIDYVGTWTTGAIGANYLYKESVGTSTANDYFDFDFSGTSISILYTSFNNRGITKAQISNDGGTNWFAEKLFTDDQTSGVANYSTPELLWENLPDTDYRVRVINITGTFELEALSYTIHARPYPITDYYDNTDTKTIDDVPAGYFLNTGTFTGQNSFSTDFWNCRFAATADTTGATSIEFKFYGNKCWIMPLWNYNSDISYNIQFDTGSGYSNIYNKVNSFTPISGNGANNPLLCGAVRVDNGTLPTQENKIKVTFSGGTSAVLWAAIFVSSDLADSTHSRSLITGNIDVIPNDDPRWTFGVNWTVGDAADGFFRRTAFTSTANDYATCDISGLSDIRAIYLIDDASPSRGKMRVDLGSGNKEKFFNQTSSTAIRSNIRQIYDYKLDGSLDGFSNFRIARFADLTVGTVEGIIVEYFDETATDGTGVTGLNHINIHPKMSRYNNSNASTGWKSAVSNTYRFEIQGEKTDDSQPRENWCDSGYLFAQNVSCYFNHGLPFGSPLMTWRRNDIPSAAREVNGSKAADGNENSCESNYTVPGIGVQNTNTVSDNYTRIIYKPNYVV
jgi:hypothetical protein